MVLTDTVGLKDRNTLVVDPAFAGPASIPTLAPLAGSPARGAATGTNISPNAYPGIRKEDLSDPDDQNVIGAQILSEI